MKERSIVVLLTLAALVYRILHFWIFSNEIVVGGDQMQYVKLARRFAEGDFYGVLHPYWAPAYPVLLGIASSFSDSLLFPSIFISVITGSLAVPLTYFLVRQSYTEREAGLAAAIAVFYPHLITSTFALGTENIYLLWITGALIFGWRGLKNESGRDFLLTGVLLGLAYLTRPEAFAYPLFFALIIFGRNLPRRILAERGALVQIGAMFLGFALLAAPYLFYLKCETGHWTISDKTRINSIAGELNQIEATEDETQENSARGMNSEAVKFLIYAVYLNSVNIHQSFPSFLPPLLLIFVALGLFRQSWDKEKLRRESYLIGFCLITILGYAVTTVQVRYFYMLLPIFFGWTARGIVEGENWLRETLHNQFPQKHFGRFDLRLFAALGLLFIYFYALPLNFFMRSHETAWQATAYEERDAGIWLKQNGKPSPYVFSASSRPVFYAEGRQLSPWTTNNSEILAGIKNSGVDYVITSDRSLKRHPYLENFDELIKASADFELVYTQNEQSGYRISIYKLK